MPAGIGFDRRARVIPIRPSFLSCLVIRDFHCCNKNQLDERTREEKRKRNRPRPRWDIPILLLYKRFSPQYVKLRQVSQPLEFEQHVRCIASRLVSFFKGGTMAILAGLEVIAAPGREIC